MVLFFFGSLLCFLGVWVVSSGRDDGDNGYTDGINENGRGNTARTVPAPESSVDHGDPEKPLLSDGGYPDAYESM